MYFGQIWIPGVTANLENFHRLVSMKNGVQIPFGIPAKELYLRLGYVDTDYQLDFAPMGPQGEITTNLFTKEYGSEKYPERGIHMETDA